MPNLAYFSESNLFRSTVQFLYKGKKNLWLHIPLFLSETDLNFPCTKRKVQKRKTDYGKKEVLGYLNQK